MLGAGMYGQTLAHVSFANEGASYFAPIVSMSGSMSNHDNDPMVLRECRPPKAI